MGPNWTPEREIMGTVNWNSNQIPKIDHIVLETSSGELIYSLDPMYTEQE